MDEIRVVEAEAVSGPSERENFERGLRAGFVDVSEKVSERFLPRLIANDKRTGSDLLTTIKRQLSKCDRFDICVAFVSESGLQPLVEILSELEKRDVCGRVLTSTYLNFNSPDVFRKLLGYRNISTRVYQGNLHAKGYVFDRGDTSTVIVGSSNLTQMALTCNREWNIMFRSYGEGGLLLSLRNEFEDLWEDGLTSEITEAWIEGYETSRSSQKRQPSHATFRANPSPTAEYDGEIRPNQMQRSALEALAKLHERNEPRALLVSATGTGKTYLSAFDIAAVKPRRVLFLAHRQRIIDASRRSYQRLLGTSYSCCAYVPGAGDAGESCVFAMCSTIVRHLDEFSRDAFDYIVIDEAHRTGSGGYQKIMDYFTPKFYLGMTATPTRTDGYDVFALFNHVIAFQITLQDALANDMLAPFHYFGIADLRIDDEDIDDPTFFSRLTSSERVKHITSKIEQYTVGRSHRRGLVFCNRNDEAAELSRQLNELGYRTCALSGKNSDEERDAAIARLEAGELEYIFSVDIFNEGVDIPSLNQIVMLRRTESAIVFVQQLGRGLRKSEGKDYALVLDFIGNYQKNFFVPIALSGDRSYNKDTLRAIVKEGSSVIPGCSTVSFDKISEARIYEAIDGGDFSAARLLRDEYRSLRQMLGRIPSLSEFDANGSIDPLRIFKKFGSYHAFLQKYESEYTVTFSSRQEGVLKFISQKLASGKQLEDLLLLKRLILGESQVEEEASSFERFYDGRTLEEARHSAISLLSGSFLTLKGFVPLVREVGDACVLSEEFAKMLGDVEFKRQVLEAVDFGLERHRLAYQRPYRSTNLVLNAKYTYEEVCYLLNWEKNVNGQNIGGYKYDDKTKTFPVFINYEKDPDISDTTKYEDRFISNHELIAISKQSRHLDSKEIERIRQCPGNGMKPYLFVRKNKNDGDGSKEFYFLGEMRPTGEFREFIMPGTTKSAVEITYELMDPVRQDLYDYLTSNIELLEEKEEQVGV
ncbi:DUF3427 domain-containing protein [Olsenella sp. An293]|uniref:DUF3427 domain-containing protein n=1 Tax=Olsenella sp. An293 TaxID=1965626 RepID=UPI000B39C95A|nr:DUF3427 domain-containing protein [Olsenella sp. An293]OUO32054.1 hypothetical protein B5F85_07860 [Olsenella sp. An293]